MSTDTLFEQHSIKEIQEIERKLRNDIEHKKEELRQMVGERYRDLMEAADTITEMKQTSEKVAFHISCVEKHCDQLRQACRKSNIMENVKLKVAERKRQNENLFAVAAMVKILMDCPAKIWSFIEGKDYLSALKLYLLARHTHSLLILDPVYTRQNILSSFPIINKQWASTHHFQHVLLQKSKETLRVEKLVAEDIIGPLCCILFLSDASLEQVFQEVLSTRKAVAMSVFKPEKSAKVQICELICIIQNTLEVAHSLFYPVFVFNEAEPTNLLQNSIQDMIKKDSESPISLLGCNNGTFQFLGKDVIAFRPSLSFSAISLKIEYLQETCQKWIENLKSDLKNHLSELLNYVTSVKGLSSIKDAVADIFNENSSQWLEVCDHVFGRSFCLWECFLKENFITRTKDIISTRIENAVESFIKSADKAYNNIQDGKIPDNNENISLYIWAESDSDLVPNLGWTPHHQRHIWDSGTLGMKSYSLTPKIQSICSTLDKGLDDLLTDISCFSPSERNVSESLVLEAEFMSSISGKMKPSDPTIDFKVVCHHVTKVSEKSFESLGNYFEKQLTIFQERDIADSISGIIFFGHLSRGLTKLCPHIIQCLQCENLSRLQRQFSSGFATTPKEDILWTKLKDRLLNFSDDAFRAWSKILIADIVNKFQSEFVVFSETSILKSLLQWEKIKIQEENEEGATIESVLRIPQQISVQLYNCIYKFCLETSKIGGHAISSPVRSEIREDFLQMLMVTYADKIENRSPDEAISSHLVQTQSLQLYFDVQFLIGLMGPKEKDEPASSLPKEILAKVVAKIDPFDMDVFTPYLQTNLKKALQKSLLLLSLAVSPEQASQLSSLKLSPPSGHDEHNLMLTPTASGRLPLLPFAPRSTAPIAIVSESTSSLNAPNQAVISRSHNSSPNFISSLDGQSGVFKSSSFYDRVTAMSSSWFGGT